MKTEAMEVSEALDFSAFIPSEDFVLDILSANGNPTGWKWTLLPPGAEKTQAYADRIAKRELHKAKQIEQAQVNGKKFVSDEVTPAESRREYVGGIVARVKDFTPIRLQGQVYEFSDDTAIDLLIRPELGFVLTQITDALKADRVFTKTSAKP